MENNGTKEVRVAEKLQEALQELIGLHRQLYEVVKQENDAITNADVKRTYDAAAAKEALIHWIHQSEMSRQAVVSALVQEENISHPSPTLKEIILHLQANDADLSNRLQVSLQTLVVLIDRVKKQNELNGNLVGESLKHIHNMKKNIFGETTHQGRTYNQHGQKNQGGMSDHGPRMISKEV